MIHLFINALAASTGGGLTYVRNVIPHLAARADVRATVLVNPAFPRELGPCANVDFIETQRSVGVAGRFWFEQRDLPRLIRRSGANVLLSTGNFALWNSPVPQILLSRNALYTSSDFMNDLRRRGDYRLWLDTQLKASFAQASIRQADVTVAPSEAFAQELREWTGRDVLAIHHGFDTEAFARNRSPLPTEIQAQLQATEGNLRLLFVSHYNYYRNFETLLRAIPLLKRRVGQDISLLLTCRLRSEDNPGSYAADSAKALVERLGIGANVVELGAVLYGQLHHVYRAANVYVTPAYAESFAHPLVEAMSSGLPVIASDLAVHREICGDAALYFSRFSPNSLAEAVATFIASPGCRKASADLGKRRSMDFSWEGHVADIVRLAERLAPSGWASCLV
jgi:glycosyltransferase involved in cell wall biosynthesis